MKANEVPNDTWFMVNRTHKWFKKTGTNKTYVTATVIGDKNVHNIPKDEEVMVRV